MNTDVAPARQTREAGREISPQEAPPVIQAEGLTKAFGDQLAVDNASFHVPHGVIFGCIGPSGSGKTTIVRLLTGILTPTAGRVTLLGRSPQSFTSALRERLGYMPQHFVLYPHLSAWENLNFTASLYGMGLRRGKRFKQLLEFVELYEHRGKLARHLSGGMQRRLALAATLAHDPDVIFLDEPTAGVDPVLRRKFWDYFRSITDKGHTIFVTTQYVNEAAYCDLVAILAEGRILMVETPDGLRHRAFGGDVVDLHAGRPLDYRTVTQIRALPFVREPIHPVGESGLRIVVDDAGTAIPDLMEWARSRQLDISSIEEYSPPLDDVFVEVVKREQNSV